ncbi:hypothetical protein K9M59_01415 [Candidatus Gracilibacteria bacterium]|nr:hypothetical protein [Candidatus Gracilibacteria bacterium]MCF7819807.1 hypothetical protein [Candidatus Gracilibacteria bacterium]
MKSFFSHSFLPHSSRVIFFQGNGQENFGHNDDIEQKESPEENAQENNDQLQWLENIGQSKKNWDEVLQKLTHTTTAESTSVDIQGDGFSEEKINQSTKERERHFEKKRQEQKAELLNDFSQNPIIQEIFRQDQQKRVFHLSDDPDLQTDFTAELQDLFLQYKEGTITEKDLSSRGSEKYLDFLRKRASRISGKEFSQFVEKYGGTGVMVQELGLKPGEIYGMSSSQFNTLSDVEKKEIALAPLLEPINLSSLPKDRVIDGIQVHQFIEQNNVRNYLDLIRAVEDHYGYPEMLQQILWTESRGDAMAVSPTYCVGMFQASSYFYGTKGRFNGDYINPFNRVEAIIRAGKFVEDLAGGGRNQRSILTRYNNDPQVGNYAGKVQGEYKTFIRLLDQGNERFIAQNSRAEKRNISS